MAIERDFKPMKIHKNLVIKCLYDHPEDLNKIFHAGQFDSVQQAIKALQDHPGEWIVNGVLEVPGEGLTVRKERED